MRGVFQQLCKYPQRHKVAFLWDPDYLNSCNDLDKTETVLPCCLINRKENYPAGIESLFDKKFFSEDVMDENPGKLPGTYNRQVNKNKFCEKILAEGNKKDFSQFKNTFETLKKFFKK